MKATTAWIIAAWLVALCAMPAAAEAEQSDSSSGTQTPPGGGEASAPQPEEGGETGVAAGEEGQATGVGLQPGAAAEGSLKLRPPPGRAISSDEIEGRTRQLSKLMESSEERLRALADRVLTGKIGRAGSLMQFNNEMGPSFKLVKAVFALDGAPIFNRIDESGDLGARDQIELFNGSIVPGEHRLSVNLEFRGHGYGIFSYLKGYRFKVRSSYTFRVAEGKLSQVRIVSYEKGDQNTPLEERPDVRYVERVEDLPASGAITTSADDSDE